MSLWILRGILSKGGNIAAKSSNDMKAAMNDVCRCTAALLRVDSQLHQSARFFRKTAKHGEFSSDWDSDSDLEERGRRGESQFWRTKIRTFHGILDVNKDGVISFDDFRLLSDRFVDLGHLGEKHTNEFRAVIKDLWEKRWGEITPYNLVTVEQYLEDMHHVVNDKKLIKRCHSFLPYLFKAVDNDHDHVITVDEFKLFYECLGLGNDEAVVAFKAIDDNDDGKLTLKEFVKHGREFFLSEDDRRPSKHFWGPLIEH